MALLMCIIDKLKCEGKLPYKLQAQYFLHLHTQGDCLLYTYLHTHFERPLTTSSESIPVALTMCINSPILGTI